MQGKSAGKVGRWCAKPPKGTIGMEYTTGRNDHLENGILLCDSVLGDFDTTMIELVSVYSYILILKCYFLF